jgi:hypothetical protein
MTVLDRYAKRQIDHDQLVTSLRAVGRSAKESQILPEKLIITLKLAWGQVIPQASGLERRADDRLLARLVTSCLDGYFGS